MISLALFVLCLMFLPLIIAMGIAALPFLLVVGLIYLAIVTFGGATVGMVLVFGPLLLVLVETLRERWKGPQS